MPFLQSWGSRFLVTYDFCLYDCEIEGEGTRGGHGEALGLRNGNSDKRECRWRAADASQTGFLGLWRELQVGEAFHWTFSYRIVGA